MKQIGIGTHVVVNVNGSIVRGVVAHALLSSPLPQYTRDVRLYVVYGGIDHDSGLTVTVSEKYFEWIAGKANPDFRGVASWYKDSRDDLSAKKTSGR